MNNLLRNLCIGVAASALLFGCEDETDGLAELSMNDVNTIATSIFDGNDNLLQVVGDANSQTANRTARAAGDTALVEWDCLSGGTASLFLEETSVGGNITYTASSCGQILRTVDGTITLIGENDGSLSTFTVNADISFDTILNTSASTIGGYTLTYDNITTAYTLDINVDINNSIIGGTINVVTPALIEGYAGSHPTTGELLVTGANNAAIHYTASDLYLYVEIDLNGDGVYEPLDPILWEDL